MKSVALIDSLASFMLRVYAMMGLSRRGLIISCLLGLVGASTIGLDVVRILSAKTTQAAVIDHFTF